MSLQILSTQQKWKSVISRYKMFYEHFALDAFKLLDQDFDHFVSRDLFKDFLTRLKQIKDELASQSLSRLKRWADKIVKVDKVPYCEFWRIIQEQDLHEYCE